MAATAPIPTLPGVTEEQVLHAMEIVSRVYAEAGVSARIEPRYYRDPESHDWQVIEIRAVVDEEAPIPALLDLSRKVATELASQGLYEPEVAIAARLILDW